MNLLTDKNYKWIYTYDYAPDSVWEPWRESDTEPSWIEDETIAVSERVSSIASRGNLLTFVLLSDSHYVTNGTWDDTVLSLKALEKKINLDGVIHLGDLSDGLLPLAKTKEIEHGCLKDMEALGKPVYVVPGNHDYNYFRKNPDVTYPEKPRYFVDYEKQKLRLVFIDSFDPKDAVRYGFSEDCIKWLDDSLRSTPAGYLAVVFSHVPPLVRLQAWAKDIRNRHQLMEVLNKHADRIMAYFNGHNHCDLLFNDLHNGQFPVISVNCAKCEYFLEHKPEGAVVPERRLGDRTQESFDIMQIDSQKKIIYLTRFGAGADRIIENSRAYWV
ncbi:metallophosphoesterase [Butyrivibrio sp. MB2005]|uniref:metallophosphoesterase n=1 Tax=Butyrivibrio sp. MB2005 TaxID=1280678 RepID=UPI00040057AF|nr:metallophosphoesterase [Butyrivibrio sp. MB2005]